MVPLKLSAVKLVSAEPLPSVASNVLVPVGKVYTPVSSAAVNEIVLLMVSVLPSMIVNVEPVAGVVIVSLLMLVADATPSVGVVNDGDVSLTTSPVPFHVKSVEVAMNEGAAVAPVLFASTVFAPAVAAYEVVLPELVITPERLALVTTVRLESVPLMLPPTGMVVVAIHVGVSPLIPSMNPFVPALMEPRVLVPVKYGSAFVAPV